MPNETTEGAAASDKEETAGQDPAAAWQAEVLALLGELGGGTLDRLQALAAAPPAGAAALPALAAVLRRLHLYDVPRPGDAAAGAGKGLVETRVDAAGAVVAGLVRGLLAEADRALDGGANDPADPIVRAGDFGRSPAEWGFECLTTRVLAGDRRHLPAGHPALALDPVPWPGGQHLIVLGAPTRRWFRLSKIRELTDGVRRFFADKRAEEQRIAGLERERERIARENSPEGMRARITELEKQLAARGAVA